MAADRVKLGIRMMDDAIRTLIGDMDASTMKMRFLAEDLEKHGKSDLVGKLGSATLEMVSTSALLKHHQSSLQFLSDSYQPTDEPTDFSKLLHEKRKQLEEAAPCEPENSRFYRQFQEAVWNVHHAGEPMPGQEMDDIVMTTSEYGIKNTTCPLSGKPVTELEDPVRSSGCQHIYDRAAVFMHMRRRSGRPIRCPIAGCPKILVADNLSCDQFLKLDIEELRTRTMAESTHQVEDFTDLEAVPESQNARRSRPKADFRTPAHQ